jgi:hypothetical protein
MPDLNQDVQFMTYLKNTREECIEFSNTLVTFDNLDISLISLEMLPSFLNDLRERQLKLHNILIENKKIICDLQMKENKEATIASLKGALKEWNKKIVPLFNQLLTRLRETFPDANYDGLEIIPIEYEPREVLSPSLRS